MSDLTGRTQNNTYRDLLHFENSNLGFDGTLRQIESGNGVGSALSLSTVGAAIAGTLSISGLTTFATTPNVNGNTIWHAGNDGIGSGLDADTVRGAVVTSFNPADNQTITGDWQFNGALTTQTPLGSIKMTGSRGGTFGDLEAGLSLFDGASQVGKMGFFENAEAIDGITIESLVPGGDGIALNTDGLSISLINTVSDILLDAIGFIDLLSDDDTTITSNNGTVWLTAGTDVQLDNINGLAIITQDYTALTATSSAIIRDGFGTAQFAGFNGMPSAQFSVAAALNSDRVGYKFNFIGGATAPLSIAVDADIPIGATWILANLGTSVFTMDTTGITLNWLDGGGVAPPTGTRTIAIAGIATLVKRAAGIYDIWGAGIT